MNNTNDLDLRLKMQGGFPISIYDEKNKPVCKFYPPKLKEIVDYGFVTFLQKAALLSINILEQENTEDKKYDLRDSWRILLSDPSNLVQIQTAIAIFIKELVLVHPETLEITIIDFNDKQEMNFTNRIISSDNCNYLVRLIAMSLCMKDKDLATSTKQESESVRRIKEKLAKYKEKLRKLDKESDESLDLSDIIEIVISKNFGINFLNVWELTYFALYEMFMRMQVNEAYDIGVKSLLAGAKSEDVKLKPWLSKLDKGGTQ